MLRKIFIIVILMFSSLKAEIVREHLLSGNSILTSNWITNMYKDSHGRLWISSPEQLLFLENNIWNEISQEQFPGLVLDIDDILTTIRNIYIQEDSYGNIIGHNNGGTAIFSLVNGKWSIQKYESKEYPYLAMTYNPVVYKDKIIHTFFSSSKLLLIEYDKKAVKYKKEIKKIDIPYIKDGSLIPKCQFSTNIYFKDASQGFLSYNVENNSWFRILKAGNIYLDSLNLSNISNCRFSPTNELYGTINSKGEAPQILKMQGLTDSTISCCQVITSPIVNPVSNGKLRDFIFLNDTEMLFSYFNMLLYYTPKTGFRLIPKPTAVLADNWYPQLFILHSENELWISGQQTGIIKCNLDELLASAQPISVDFERDLPIIGFINIYPLPANDKITFDFYMQTGIAKDLKVEVYTTDGTKVVVGNYEITQTNKMIHKLNINISNLSCGTYIINVSNGTSLATEKFIVQ